ncbi:PcfJ domain-containing protein [Myxococcota bacterium]|nr:PcfJ domain-containing protein [Myxococcota bacterium]MBU1433277.1 PcfJ domain-containing protein [Myxococcota bacterium]MBU1899001.1 PcfJ domain-containing protein [Myxococcota bacterium]
MSKPQKNKTQAQLRRRAHIENKRARQQQRADHERQKRAAHEAIAAAWREAKKPDPLAAALAVFGADAQLNEVDRGHIEQLVAGGARFITPELLTPLSRVLSLHQSWARPLEAWRPSGRSKAAELRSLIDHLFVLYPTPAFLYRAFDQDERAREALPMSQLFVRLAAGGRRKDIPDLLGVPLTKQMITLFLSAKAKVSPLEALRAAQVEALCDAPTRARPLARALMSTSFGVGRYPHGEDKGQAVIHWLARQPELRVEDVGPLVDYIIHAQADEAWSLKGRTVASLSRDAQAWHLELARLRKIAGEVFPASPFEGWTRTEAADLRQGLYWRYQLEEIPTSKALAAEGRAMGHCVYSYARQIISGRISIWSLRRQRVTVFDGVECEAGVVERLLTLEVRNDARQIPQVRGRFNRKAQAWERTLVRRWAQQNGLSLSASV